MRSLIYRPTVGYIYITGTYGSRSYLGLSTGSFGIESRLDYIARGPQIGDLHVISRPTGLSLSTLFSMVALVVCLRATAMCDTGIPAIDDLNSTNIDQSYYSHCELS